MASDFTHTRTAIRRSKLPAIIALGALALAALPATQVHVSESRIYRDVFNLTPFKNVEIHKVVIDGDTMTVWGAFEKVRCTKIANRAHTQRKGDPYNYPAEFSSDGEHPLTPENRTATERSEFFGPWVITSQIPQPDSASFHPVHRCDGIIESNMFFELPWEDYENTDLKD